MRIYKHYRPSTVFLPLIFLVVLGAFGIGALLWALASGATHGPPGPPPFVFLFLVVIAAVNGWTTGGIALEVRLADDGHVEFIAPLRKRRIAVLDIVSIRPSKLSQLPVYVVRHRNGTCRVHCMLDGMHELVGELKRQKPAIELQGV